MSELVIKSESPKMFDSIACRYDVLNQVLSFGMAMGWRQRIVACFPEKTDMLVLDVATGTADIPLLLARSLASIKRIVGVDLSQGMLAAGRRKVKRAGLSARIDLKTGDGQRLFFEDRSFDVVTLGFGLRNFPDPMQGLMEACRVLKTNGRLVVLEFSRPEAFPARQGHQLYMQFFVPMVGLVLTGNLKAYEYLSHTVMVFPHGERFLRILRQVGFREVKRKPLLFGAVTIYIGIK